jgi:hypothetical protein
MSNSVFGLRLSDSEHHFLDHAADTTDGILSKAGVVRVLIRQAMNSDWKPLDTGVTLTERATASTQEGGASVVSSSSSSITNKSINRFIKSLQPSLQCHEDLILGFWKAKTGSKSEAGWKLLNTELVKIQEAYGDKVVRDQLELATANRWKGVTLKNYEQFGLKQQPAKQQKMSLTEEARSLGLI